MTAQCEADRRQTLTRLDRLTTFSDCSKAAFAWTVTHLEILSAIRSINIYSICNNRVELWNYNHSGH